MTRRVSVVIDERTRIEVQRLCTHVIARERYAREAHIGLASIGGGIGTTALCLVPNGLRRSADGERRPLTTLADAAEFAGVSLDPGFSVGRETLPIGDEQAPLAIDPGALVALLGFFDRAWRLLTEVADGATITLWPEHFDAALIWRERANVGASPGDRYSSRPYVYVGPWGDERPGPSSLWNVPFGASLDADGDDRSILAFVRTRLTALEGVTPV
jgi:hypothetical protein